MRRSATFVAVLAMLCAASFPAFAADGPPPTTPPDKIAGAYLVLLDGEPVVAYTGGVPGLDATAVTVAGDLDPSSAAVSAYAAHLRSRHDDALRRAGIGPDAKVYDYTHALDGFAAVLTPAEAASLAAQPGVNGVLRDEMRTTASDSTPDFLGLTDPRGPWATGYTGEGVVVGVIDTGIWPEHASFADEPVAGSTPPEFDGTACDFGDAVPGATAHNAADAAFTCNHKIVAAEAFSAGFTSSPDRAIAATDYLSARDASGHGTQTAAIAAGNRGVATGLDTTGLPIMVSGVAPGAHVAAYKSCWTADGGDVGCATSDLVAAIDRAVADGVDVIAYAVTSQGTAIGVDDIALMYAASAGILVAAPAGNGGPGEGSTASPGTTPWVTSVAAASEDRALRARLALGDGTTIEATGVGAATSTLPLIDAAELGNAACDPDGTFAESVAGSIVLCAGSELAPPDITRAVADQGGAAVVLVAGLGDTRSTTGSAALPLISIDAAGAARLAGYLEESGDSAVAMLGDGVRAQVTGSVVAPFSARGPNPLTPDILKPDVTAPGVAILAAAPPGAQARDGFAVHSGTSAAAAHVAGVYALMRQAHPTWSAAAAASALVTTASREVWTDDDLTPAGALAAGAGLIRPGGAITRRGTLFNPGLVYERSLADHLGLLCGLGGGGIADSVACASRPVAARDLNMPSVAVADVVGTTTVVRTVTSVADKARTFEAQVDAPPGFFVEVEPARITLAPGETARFALTLTPTRAPSGEWRQGSLTWNSEDYRVVTPIVARAAAIAAPAELTESGTTGAAVFDVTFGYSGEYEATARGLVAPEVTRGAVDADPTGNVAAAIASGVGAVVSDLDVTEDTVFVRIVLAGDDGDLDLYVLDEEGGLVASSAASGSLEQVDLELPVAGDYSVVVHGSDVGGDEAAFTLSRWVVGAAGPTPISVVQSPSLAAQNGEGVISVAWTDAPSAEELIGAVVHADERGMVAVTAITVDTTLGQPRGPMRSSDG